MIAYQNENFWLCYPQLKDTTTFKKIYELSKDKNKTSMIAWGVFLFCDPKSIYKNLPPNERKDEVNEYVGEDIFAYEPVVHLVENEYKRLFMTPMQRVYSALEEKVHQRAQLIESLEYTEDTFTIVDKLIIDSKKVNDALEELRSKLESEEEEGVVKGKAAKSISQSGLI